MRRGPITLVLVSAILLSLSIGHAAVKKWNAETGNRWDVAGNWLPTGAPTSSDDVVLDNTYVGGSYAVVMNSYTPASSCRTLTVGYAGNANTISLYIVNSNAVATLLTIAGNGTSADDFVVDSGGVFRNSSGAATTDKVVSLGAGNTARIKSGGRFYNNTDTDYNAAFPAGQVAFDSGSTMEFGNPAATVACADIGDQLSGRTFGHLVLSGPNANGLRAGGTGSSMVVKNHLTVMDSASLLAATGFDFSGTVQFRGNITNNAPSDTLNFGGTGSYYFNGTSRILPPGGGQSVKFEQGFTVQGGGSLAIDTDKVTVVCPKSVTVNSGGRIAFGSDAKLGAGGGTGSYSLVIDSGGTIESSKQDGLDTVINLSGAVLDIDPGANLVFSHTTTGFNGTGVSRTPPTINNLTIDNAPGVQTTLSDGVSLSVNGGLTVNSGSTLAVGTNALFLNGPGSVVAGGLTVSDGGMLAVGVEPASLRIDGDALINGAQHLSGGAVTVNGSLSVGGTGVLDANTVAIDGSGTFTVSAGGTFEMGHAGGIDGQVGVGGGRVLSSGGRYVYDGTVAQVTGAGLPPLVDTLEVDNPSGVSMSGDVGALNLVLTAGVLGTGAHTVTVGSSAAVTGTIAGTGTVEGRLRRFVSDAAATYAFPISYGGSLRALEFCFVAAPTTGGSITASFTATDPGEFGMPLTDGALVLTNVAPDGYWTAISGDDLAGGSYSLTLAVPGFDSLGDPATLRLVKRSGAGSPWQLDGSAGTNSPSTVARDSMSGFSDFAIAGVPGQVPVGLCSLSVE